MLESVDPVRDDKAPGIEQDRTKATCEKQPPECSRPPPMPRRSSIDSLDGENLSICVSCHGHMAHR